MLLISMQMAEKIIEEQPVKVSYLLICRLLASFIPLKGATRCFLACDTKTSQSSKESGH